MALTNIEEIQRLQNSGISWDKLVEAGKAGKLAEMGFPNIKWDNGKFTTQGMFNDHPITLNSDGNGGIRTNAEEAKKGSFISNVLGFKALEGKNVLKDIGSNPLRAFVGAVDPFSTKVWNKALGKQWDPLVDQMGGATPQRSDQARAAGIDPKNGQDMEKIAHAVAAIYGGSALGGLLGGAGEAAGAVGGSGTGGASISALSPEAVWAGGLPTANAAVAGMGGASGIGSAGGALGVAGGSAGAGLLSGGGSSFSALSPEAVQAGGTTTATNAAAGLTPQSIGQAGGGLNVAGAGTNYLDTANKALKAGSAISGLGGGSGGQGGGMAGNSTQTQQIDPRMAKYIYGDDTTKGILDLAKSMYDKNPDGMNDQMRQGLNNQWNTLNDPALKQGYQQMANTGMGLLSMPIAGNPFTNGMGGRPQAMQQQQMPAFNPSGYQGLLGGNQAQQNPFSLMQMGQASIPNSPLMSGGNSNPLRRLGN